MAYGGDFDRGPFMNTINWVTTSISLVIVTLRFVSSGVLERQTRVVEDGFMVFGMAIVLARTVYMTYCIDLGYGHHFDYLLAQDPENAARLGRLSYILTSISLWTWTMPKFPVAILLVRLFDRTNRRIAWFIYPPAIFLVIWAVILTIITFIQCRPIERNWDRTVPGYCWDSDIYLNMGYFGGALSAAVDFAYAIYPGVQISKLQMDRPRKILAAFSLSLGIPAGVVTIYKLTVLAPLINAHDPTWATIPLETWNSVESCALIIAASGPMTKPLMSAVGTRIKSMSSVFSSWTKIGGSGGSSRGRDTSWGSSTAGANSMKSAGRGNKGSVHPVQPGMQKTSDEILLDEMARERGHGNDMV